MSSSVRELGPGAGATPADEVDSDAVRAAKAVLRAHHAAAGEADFDAYFASIAEDAVVLGTAAVDRFTVPVYRRLLRPHFDRGAGFRTTPLEQHVHLSANGRFAWFEERLVRPPFGELRGTGVLRLDQGTWKIVHSSRAFAIPNEVFADFDRMRRELPGGSVPGQFVATEALREDFSLLRNTLQEWHPALYEYETKTAIDQAFDEAFAAVDAPMTSLAFERLLIPLIARVHCVHTRILPTAEHEAARRRRGTFLPLDLRWISDRLHVCGNYDGGDEPPLGAEILEINGDRAAAVVERLLAAIPADGRIRSHRVKTLNDGFAAHYQRLIDDPTTFDIRYLPRGETAPRSVSVAAVSFTELRMAELRQPRTASGPTGRGDGGPAVSSEFLDAEQTAILRVRSFDRPIENNLPRAFDEFFARAKAEGTTKLILDLRGNSGGRPEPSAYLFSHLAAEPFRYLRTAPMSGRIAPATNRFSGELYVLIDGGCTSTTGHFISLVAHHERGTFIGETSGSTYICNDASRDLLLPNTGIRVHIARRTFETVVEGLEKGVGIRPDHEVRPGLDDILSGTDVAMRFARRLCAGGPPADAPDPRPAPISPDLSPAAWPASELRRRSEENRPWGRPKPLATGTEGMVAGTTHLLAVRAGVEALRQGGTAADAACTTALTQIALNAGATVSYAGVLSMVYYEAESGEVLCLTAPYAVPLGEARPGTIPGPGTPSGRTALVPGFMKGIEAAHERFGELPFGALFGPAIYFAERGVVVDGPLEDWIQSKRTVLSRLPATRRVFSGPDGEFVVHGDVLRQPELASTLRAVAQDGADHMYRGPWADAFVAAVNADGGHMSAEDLSRYEVVWAPSLRATYREREIHTVAAPSVGGHTLLEAMNLLELADPAQYGSYTESAEACYWLMQCARSAYLQPRLFTADEARASKGHAARIWEVLKRTGGHSDGVVAVDAAGNVAAMLHTINTVTWGTTGIFVHGVSIPDSACYQQRRLKIVGPGSLVPNEMNPAIVVDGGRPILACSAVGSGLHAATVGCLHNALDLGMDPKQAVEAPTILSPYGGEGGLTLLGLARQAVTKGRFPAELLREVRERGLGIVELDPVATHGSRGYWTAITIDPETGERRGGVTPSFNGAALASDG